MIAARPLEATAFQVGNIRMAYVFYESGLSINVMYDLDDPKSAVNALLASRTWHTLLPEAGTRPRIFYLT